MTGEPVPTTYAALRHEIVQVFLEGKERARQAVEQEKLRTCWEVGDRLHQHLLQQRDRAEYGERVMARLAEDLGMLPQRLYEMLDLRRVFPILRSSGKLTLTHYVKLLQVPKREVRERYLLRAEEAGWSVRELAEAIRAGAVEGAAPGALPEDASPEPAARYVPRRGQLYTYRLVQSAGGLKLDVGFGVRVAVDLGRLEDARVRVGGGVGQGADRRRRALPLRGGPHQPAQALHLPGPGGRSD